MSEERNRARPNDAQPEVDALRVLADRVNRWFMFDNAPNLLAMREALDNVQRAQPRTDSPVPDYRELLSNLVESLNGCFVIETETAAVKVAWMNATTALEQQTEPAADSALPGVSDSVRLSLVDIFGQTDRLDKIAVTLDAATRRLTVTYDDLDDEWCTDLLGAPPDPRPEPAVAYVAGDKLELADHRELTDTDVEGIYNDGWRDAIESVRKLLDLAGSPPSSSDPKVTR